MKRWFSLLLAAVVVCAQLSGPITARAEELAPPATEAPTEEVAVEEAAEGAEASEALVCEDSVAALPEPVAAEEAAFDLFEDIAPEAEAQPAEPEPEPVEETFAARYGRVNGEEAPVYGEDGSVVAWLAGGAVVLMPEAAADGRAAVVLDSGTGVLEGAMDEAALTPLTDEEISAYMDAAVLSGPVFAYRDDPTMPLLPVPCRFPAEEPEAVIPEDAREPAEESAEDPAEESAGESAEDPAEESAEESAGESAEDPAEESAGESAEDPAEESTEAPSEESDEAEAPEVPEAAEAAPAEEMMLSEAAAEPAFTLVSGDAQLGVGDSYVIEAVDASGAALPASALDIENDSNAVSVDAETGVVTATCVGTAQINVTYAAQTQSANISVFELPGSVTLSPSKHTLGEAQQYDGLKVGFPDETAAAFTFTSSNEKVAVVNASTGEVTGVSAGKASITVETSNGRKASCAVTVVKAPQSVSLSAATLKVGAGDDSYQLTAQVPEGAFEGPLTWKSSDSDVVGVRDGRVIPFAAGSATITVNTYNGKSARCDVTVTGAPDEAAYTSQKVVLAVNDTVKPAYRMLDAQGAAAAGRPTFSVESASVEGCITLNAGTGAVKGRKAGKAVVKMTTYNGLESTVKVVVKPAVTE